RLRIFRVRSWRLTPSVPGERESPETFTSRSVGEPLPPLLLANSPVPHLAIDNDALVFVFRKPVIAGWMFESPVSTDPACMPRLNCTHGVGGRDDVSRPCSLIRIVVGPV